MSLLLVILAIYVVGVLGGVLWLSVTAWRKLVRAPELTRAVKVDAKNDVVFGSVFSVFWPIVAVACALGGLYDIAARMAVWALITVPRRRAHPDQRIPTRDLREPPDPPAPAPAVARTVCKSCPARGYCALNGCSHRITWEGDERRQQQNDGRGCCNTGSGVRGVCSLGGIGCNVDHDTIARAHSEQQTSTPSPMTRF